MNKNKTDFAQKFHNEWGAKGKEPSIIQGVEAPKLKAHLKSEYKRIEDKSRKDAVDTAARQRPLEHGDNLSTYIMYVAEEASALNSHVSSVLQAEGMQDYKEQATYFAEEETKLLDENLSKVENKSLNKARDLRDIVERDTYAWGWFPFIILAIAVGLLGDLLYNAKALQAIGLNYLESLVVVAPVVIGLALGGYFFFTELKKDETEKSSSLKLIFSGAIILLSFVVMGYVRAYYLREMNGTNMSLTFSTLTFVILNILIFGGVSIIFHSFFPTREQFSIRRERSKVAGEVKALEAEKATIIENKKLLKSWLSNTLQTANDIVNYHNALLNENVSFFRKVAAHWIREVSTRLPYTPDCMTQNLPRVNCRYVKNDSKLLNQKNPTNDVQ